MPVASGAKRPVLPEVCTTSHELEFRVTVRNWNRTALSALGLSAVAALGLTVAASAPAVSAPKDGVSAAAAKVTITPSSNLVDGTAVTIAATGLRPDTVYHIGQCAIVGETLPCNGAETIHVSSSSSGNLSTKLTVRQVYEGTLGPENIPWGTVDCKAVPCGIGMFNDLGEGAGAAISFK
ncbi:enediyne antibiotic chromoprotein [Micromonospora sp. NPDC047620]|uniref:enediyne antibiotic chromoprotein n=1 Tax=Micromonospora sp. NPDC047620 TaxID=3364251 RepID=UPI00371C0898